MSKEDTLKSSETTAENPKPEEKILPVAPQVAGPVTEESNLSESDLEKIAGGTYGAKFAKLQSPF